MAGGDRQPRWLAEGDKHLHEPDSYSEDSSLERIEGPRYSSAGPSSPRSGRAPQLNLSAISGAGVFDSEFLPSDFASPDASYRQSSPRRASSPRVGSLPKSASRHSPTPAHKVSFRSSTDFAHSPGKRARRSHSPEQEPVDKMSEPEVEYVANFEEVEEELFDNWEQDQMMELNDNLKEKMYTKMKQQRQGTCVDFRDDFAEYIEQVQNIYLVERDNRLQYPRDYGNYVCKGRFAREVDAMNRKLLEEAREKTRRSFHFNLTGLLLKYIYKLQRIK